MATRIGRSSPSTVRNTEENIAARVPPVAADSSEAGARSSETDQRRHVQNADDPGALGRGQGVEQRDDVGDPLRRLHAARADEQRNRARPG